MSRVIVIEDSPLQLEQVCKMLDDAGLQTIKAHSVKSGKEVIESASPMDVVLADMPLPDGQCFEILYWMRRMGHKQPFLVMSRYGDYSSVQTAVNNGVAKFIDKRNLDEQLIPFVMEEIGKLSSLAFLYDDSIFERQSEQFKGLREDLKRYAMLGFRIMLTGEVGVGKHSLAKFYHVQCHRTGEFHKLDCASLTDAHETALLLFGYEKDARHPSRFDGGLLEKAKGGTIVLENVDCLPDIMQRMLLHVLQNNSYKPIGALAEKPADVMFVATLNTLPDNMNALRMDFQHYLSNHEVRVPSLRECPDDIIPLAEFFVSMFANGKYLSADVKGLLMRHQWTGNVHELKVAVQDAVSKSKDNKILVSDFRLEPAAVTGFKDAATLSMDEYLKVRIAHVLNVATSFSAAAKMMSVSRNKLYEDVNRLGIKNRFSSK